MKEEHKELTFIESVDDEMHDNILRLDQKLKGLQAEINAKIEGLGDADDAPTIEKKKQLLVLSEEVTKAINGIKKLVNLVISDEFTPKQFNEMNEGAIEALREMFKHNADKISELKEKF